MTRIRTAFTLAAMIGAGFAMPAAAQTTPVEVAPTPAEEEVNMVIVYGDDACPVSTDEVIIICARKSENDRYRIPEDLRVSDDPKAVSWAERVESFEAVGRFGTLSCSPVGVGGWTGCTQKMIDDAYADKEGGSSIRFSELIAKARAARAETIDADAAAEQERVEQLEKAYMERLARERDGETATDGDALPQPAATPPAQ